MKLSYTSYAFNLVFTLARRAIVHHSARMSQQVSIASQWDPKWKHVAVVGAGPVGLWTSIQICECGQNCAQAASFLQFEKNASRAQDTNVHVWGSTENLWLGKQIVPNVRSGNQTSMKKIETDLSERLQNCVDRGRGMERPWRFDRADKMVSTRADMSEFDLVIGADGKDSKVSELFADQLGDRLTFNAFDALEAPLTRSQRAAGQKDATTVALVGDASVTWPDSNAEGINRGMQASSVMVQLLKLCDRDEFTTRYNEYVDSVIDSRLKGIRYFDPYESDPGEDWSPNDARDARELGEHSEFVSSRVTCRPIGHDGDLIADLYNGDANRETPKWIYSKAKTIPSTFAFLLVAALFDTY